MADGDMVQKGQAWKVAFGAATYTGYLPESMTEQDTAEDELIKDERNATITHVLTNPHKIITGSFLIKSTGSITPPSKGDIVSLIGPNNTVATNYYCQDASVAFSRSVSKLTLSLLLEDAAASITPVTGVYDISSNNDLAITITFNSAVSVSSIIATTAGTLTETTHYTVVGTTLTILKAWLQPTCGGSTSWTDTLTINFDKGMPAKYVITAQA